MSTSGREIISTYLKEIDKLKSLINKEEQNINLLLQQCKEMDVNNLYNNKINSFIDELNLFKKNMDSMLATAKISTEEMEPGTLNRLLGTLHDWRRDFFKIKNNILTQKTELINKEKEMFIKNIGVININDLENSIINSFKTNSSKAFAKKVFNDNKEIFINKNQSEILDEIRNAFNKYDSYKEEMIQSVKDIVENNSDALDMLENEINKFRSSSKAEDAVELFIHANEEYSRQESIKNIIESIKKMGYKPYKKSFKKLKNKNIVLFTAIKDDGKYVDFSVELNGTYYYNFEGFEGNSHKEDIDEFMKNISKEGSFSTKFTKHIYREPKYREKFLTLNRNKTRNDER